MVVGVAAQLLRPGDAAPLLAAKGPSVAAGESHFGEPLSPRHPLLTLAVATPGSVGGGAAGVAEALPTAAAAGDAKPLAVAAGDSAHGLTIRQRCAWGKPGGNPYQGSVEQALSAARLPPAIVQQFVALIGARQISDRLVITNTAISAQRSQRQFDTRSIAMTYGNTLCLQTRVNFVADHHELADLYEVSDASGGRYSVMVPDVCGNVSVLSVRRQLADGQLMNVNGDDHPGVRHLFVLSADDPGREYVTAGGHRVAEPGTLLVVLTALGAMVYWTRRRRS